MEYMLDLCCAQLPFISMSCKRPRGGYFCGGLPRHISERAFHSWSYTQERGFLLQGCGDIVVLYVYGLYGTKHVQQVTQTGKARRTRGGFGLT